MNNSLLIKRADQEHNKNTFNISLQQYIYNAYQKT